MKFSFNALHPSLSLTIHGITLSGDIGSQVFVLEPQGHLQVQGALDPKMLDGIPPGQADLSIGYRNLNNPHNTQSLKLSFNLTVFALKFSRVTKRKLRLPALNFPVTGEPAEMWFTVERKKLGLEEYGRFAVTLEIEPYITVGFVCIYVCVCV